MSLGPQAERTLQTLQAFRGPPSERSPQHSKEHFSAFEGGGEVHLAFSISLSLDVPRREMTLEHWLPPQRTPTLTF